MSPLVSGENQANQRVIQMSDALLTGPSGHTDQLTPARFTYSTQVASKRQKAVIRAIELMGGQPRLKKLYFKNQRNPRQGESFFDGSFDKSHGKS